MTESEIRSAFEQIRVWSRHGQRAPHKPLLLLLALGRVYQGQSRLVAFVEIEDPLRVLLKEFGPKRASYHPGYPFWRLQEDGLWEVPGGRALRTRDSNTDPPITELRRVSGGFPVRVQELLEREPRLIGELTDALLAEHFPPVVHDRLRAAVGLPRAS